MAAVCSSPYRSGRRLVVRAALSEGEKLLADWVDQILLDDLNAVLGKGRVLDIPAGTGKLCNRLEAMGYDITAADLFPEKFRLPGHEAVRADMNDRIPFEDNAFDAIICQEGVEHVENLPSFFRECRRLLRDGGYLWVTTPNFMDLSGRLSYFLTGAKSFHTGFPNEETTVWGSNGDRFYHGHAFSLPFFQIRYLLRLSQFDDITLSGLGRSTTSRMLYPFVRPLSRLLIRRAFRRRSRKRKKEARQQSASSTLSTELEQLALSPDLLCSRKICVRAVLREGSFTLPEASLEAN